MTVFRNGRTVSDTPAVATSKAALIEAMIGKGREALEESYTDDIALPPPSDRPVVLKVDRLSLARSLQDVSFEVRSGEVLGIYGFMGCGQLELARILFGKLGPDHGTVVVGGEEKAFGSTAASAAGRYRLRGREPPRHAVPPGAGLQEHLDQHSRSPFALFLKPSRERSIATRQVEQLQIRPATVELELGMLSGGNQQKVALAKWLSYPPRLLVLCEPTRGMDVGAKNDVINIIRDLRARGLAIIVLSTEPETVLSLADRVIVLKRGTVVREFSNEAISKDRLLEAA